MSIDFEFKDKYNIDDLISIVTLLRAPGGCPWDREQTHESIRKNFIEETYEVIEAINKNDTDLLKEELGDVLLQVALHTEIEREAGRFDFDGVCDGICKKLIVRHPHVFGDVTANNGEEALASWDAAKQSTKGIKSQSEAMDTIPLELPALMRAQKVQHKAAKVGFDWDNADGAFDKLYEEINELKNAMAQGVQADIDEELGDMFFSCVNIARFAKSDSEEVLKASTDKFIERFRIVERLCKEQGIDMQSASLETLDALWDRAKVLITAEEQ
jgi:tetrapyrrole methylase family protein/MazG family protein